MHDKDGNEIIQLRYISIYEFKICLVHVVWVLNKLEKKSTLKQRVVGQFFKVALNYIKRKLLKNISTTIWWLLDLIVFFKKKN